MKSSARAFEHSTRNWLALAALVGTLALAGYGNSFDAPWQWLVIAVLLAVALAVSWLAREPGGWRVCEGELYFHVGRDWDLRLRPDQVAWASVLADDADQPYVRLHLRSGSAKDLPAHCMGSTPDLLDALRSIGVEVRAPDAT